MTGFAPRSTSHLRVAFSVDDPRMHLSDSRFTLIKSRVSEIRSSEFRAIDLPLGFDSRADEYFFGFHHILWVIAIDRQFDPIRSEV